MAIQRRRSLGVRPTTESRAQSTQRRTSADAAPATPLQRRATRVLARQRDDGAMVVRAPNTDGVYSDAIRESRHRPQRLREGDHLHVSDLIQKCVRARALTARFDLQSPIRMLTPSDIMTFAMGDAIHDEAKAMARDGAPHMIWGKWSCKCEFLKHDDPCLFEEIDREEECPHCHSKVDRYHEVSFFDDEYGVVGNPDLIFFIPRTGAYHVNEIKSIAPDQWKELTRPKPEHVFQVVWYWLLMQRSGMRLTDRVSIIYFTKGWLFGSQDNKKEFMFDPQAELPRLADMIEDAKTYKAYMSAIRAVKGDKSKAKLPALPLKVCASKDSKQAKTCHACDVCFEV